LRRTAAAGPKALAALARSSRRLAHGGLKSTGQPVDPHGFSDQPNSLRLVRLVNVCGAIWRSFTRVERLHVEALTERKRDHRTDESETAEPNPLS
jgi:hypothetical protein